MIELQASDFPQFFSELHGRNPFPWQEKLAEQACIGRWPEVIDVPTGSGKTACIDIALFALALRGSDVPRRIFFVVDRRVVVNEAFERVKRIRDKLSTAESGLLATVSNRLKNLSAGDEPLKAYEMRGGTFRDETWVKNPLQPAVIASTVDQVGSRLMFRGYGVSEHSWPLHAGLIGNDALIILDEAHCSLAFAQTLSRIKEYRGDSWAEEPLRMPFSVVEMTATPSRPHGERLQITDADRANETFSKRLRTPKPARLVEIKGRKDDFGKLADALIAQARELADAAAAKRVAILVNRVRTAKIVHDRLKKEAIGASVELVIGRMRPIDRDSLYENRLSRLKSGITRMPEDPMTFVVSTQCLEVGADLDFDVLVSECSSIDALQQRFGRLDRLGDFGRARGAIVIGSWQMNPKQPDPIYGEALLKTWDWLKSIADENNEVDMGVEAAEGKSPPVAQLLKSIDPSALRLKGEDAPILLPAHVDVLAQTSPIPEPSPLVELFLHGPERGVPDVQVLWRADLPENDSRRWGDIVALCPPSSRECMPVQIDTFKKWLADRKTPDETESDLSVGIQEGEPERKPKVPVLLWRGDESSLIKNISEVKPGQTLVLSASAKGWDELGHIPEEATIDVGDQAALAVRNSVSLRLHPELLKKWPETPGCKKIRDYVSQPGADRDELQHLFNGYYAELNELKITAWPHPFLDKLEEKKLSRCELNTYPDEETTYLFQARQRVPGAQSEQQVLLDIHLRAVEQETAAFASGNVTASIQTALQTAARFHDYGKADVRYQAWLRGGDLMAARFARKLIAKSGNARIGRQETVGLPSGFRHELLSLLFAERSDELNIEHRDLILHLIASHHGRCRPFAPVVLDDNADCVSYDGISICREHRIENAAHRLSSGVSERFWTLTRKYGWWGLAYLESLLRLADWKASEAENAEVSNEQ